VVGKARVYDGVEGGKAGWGCGGRDREVKRGGWGRDGGGRGGERGEFGGRGEGRVVVGGEGVEG